jgi:hypothetical protein
MDLALLDRLGGRVSWPHCGYLLCASARTCGSHPAVPIEAPKNNEAPQPLSLRSRGWRDLRLTLEYRGLVTPDASRFARWSRRSVPQAALRTTFSAPRLEPAVFIRPSRSRLRKTREAPQPLRSRSLDRDGRIRTGDPLNPIQVRYRAAPRPVLRAGSITAPGAVLKTNRAIGLFVAAAAHAGSRVATAGSHARARELDHGTTHKRTTENEGSHARARELNPPVSPLDDIPGAGPGLNPVNFPRRLPGCVTGSRVKRTVLQTPVAVRRSTCPEAASLRPETRVDTPRARWYTWIPLMRGGAVW